MENDLRKPQLVPLLVDARQAAQLCQVSRATWARWNSSGRTPTPLHLSNGCVRWRLDELKRWTEAGCPSREAWQILTTNAARFVIRFQDVKKGRNRENEHIEKGQAG